jgi:hypothetical protein
VRSAAVSATPARGKAKPKPELKPREQAILKMVERMIGMGDLARKASRHPLFRGREEPPSTMDHAPVAHRAADGKGADDHGIVGRRISRLQGRDALRAPRHRQATFARNCPRAQRQGPCRRLKRCLGNVPLMSQMSHVPDCKERAAQARAGSPICRRNSPRRSHMHPGSGRVF